MNETYDQFDLKKQDILKSILESYSLDDDQLDYLHKFHKNIFEINKTEDCLCLSNKTYEVCCEKKSDAKKENTSYISILKMISNSSLKSDYIKQEWDNLQAVKAELDAQKCIIDGCNNDSKEYHLYSDLIDETDDSFLYLNNIDNKEQIIKNINANFLLDSEKNKIFYSYKIICKEHYNNLIADQLKLSNTLKSLLANIYMYTILNNRFKRIYRKYNLSMAMSERVLIVIKWRKISNILKSLIYNLQAMVGDINNDSKSFSIAEYKMNKATNILVNDIILVPITPITFRAINSLNNPFLDNKPLFVETILEKKDGKQVLSKIKFVYKKEYKIINLYFQEWKNKWLNYEQFESWLTSNVFALANNFLVSEKWYKKLSKKDQEILNLYYYYRFEVANGAKSELDIQHFYNSFNVGINSFSSKKVKNKITF